MAIRIFHCLALEIFGKPTKTKKPVPCRPLDLKIMNKVTRLSQSDSEFYTQLLWYVHTFQRNTVTDKNIAQIAMIVPSHERHCVSNHNCRFRLTAKNPSKLHVIIVRRAGLLWSQEDFEWRWSVPLFKCLTVLEFSFILFDLCLLITFFNFIMNYVPIVTFWIFTYHKIWILSIMFCSIWSYWIIYFLACLEVSWRVVS